MDADEIADKWCQRFGEAKPTGLVLVDGGDAWALARGVRKLAEVAASKRIAEAERTAADLRDDLAAVSEQRVKLFRLLLDARGWIDERPDAKPQALLDDINDALRG